MMALLGGELSLKQMVETRSMKKALHCFLKWPFFLIMVLKFTNIQSIETSWCKIHFKFQNVTFQCVQLTEWTQMALGQSHHLLYACRVGSTSVLESATA